MNTYDYVKAWRNRTKLRAIDAFGGCCGVCGYNKCTTALEFHHIDSENKDFAISSMTKLNWNIIVNELKKCICVCSNCHREIHFGITKIPESIKRFDENFIVYHSKVLEEFDNCFCGKLKNKRLKYCSHSCACIGKQKIKWNEINLKKLIIIEKLPMTTIAKNIGVSDNAIRKRLKKIGLPSNRYEIEEYIKNNAEVA